MHENVGAVLMQWQYLLFVLPFGLGAFFLLISSLRFGGHRHHAMGHISSHAHAHMAATAHAHGAAGARGPAAGAAHRPAVAHHGGEHVTEGTKTASGVTPITIALLLLGVGRAPLPLVIEFFLICFGIAGFWAVETFVHSPHPNLFQMLPSLGLAMGGGAVGSRLAAEIVGRIMPRDETAIVSGESLYGLTGKVAFAVSETAGRVHIYDPFGTLHDESCRVAAGHPAIGKGRTVLIADRDAVSGRLIVEEMPAPLGTVTA